MRRSHTELSATRNSRTASTGASRQPAGPGRLTPLRRPPRGPTGSPLPLGTPPRWRHQRRRRPREGERERCCCCPPLCRAALPLRVHRSGAPLRRARQDAQPAPSAPRRCPSSRPGPARRCQAREWRSGRAGPRWTTGLQQQRRRSSRWRRWGRVALNGPPGTRARPWRRETPLPPRQPQRRREQRRRRRRGRRGRVPPQPRRPAPEQRARARGPQGTRTGGTGRSPRPRRTLTLHLPCPRAAAAAAAAAAESHFQAQQIPSPSRRRAASGRGRAAPLRHHGRHRCRPAPPPPPPPPPAATAIPPPLPAPAPAQQLEVGHTPGAVLRRGEQERDEAARCPP